MVSQILVAFFCYLSVLAAIGWFSRRSHLSGADFMVGSRSSSFYLTALSAHASDMGAWLFMAMPTAVYVSGICESWIAIGLCVGMFFTWKWVAPKLRRSTERLDSYTLPTFFENRFKDRSGSLRTLSAMIMIFFLTYYLSAALIAMGIMIEAIFSIPYAVGITLSVVVVVFYTFIGGYSTIVLTDFFQAIFLAFAICLVPLFGILSLPEGVSTFREALAIREGYLNLFHGTGWNVLSSILLAFGWGLGYFGQPHVISKFLGIRDPNELRKSQILGMSWQIFALTASVLVGLVGAAFFRDWLQEPQLVFADMAFALFPPFVAGFILCGILAANLSTMDSQILVCASAIGEDLYSPFAGKRAASGASLRASRIGAIVVALFALAIAFNRSYTIMDTVYYAWAGLGSAFGPLVLMSLHSKETNRHGAMAGLLVGGGTAAVWPWINPLLSSVLIPAMIPGFSLSLFSIWAVSRLTTVASDPVTDCSIS